MERRHPFDRTTTRVTLAGITLLTATATLPAPGQDEGFRALRTDSRAPYVHRLNLYDHVGQVIRTGDDPARPYSPAVTCGKCHAVSTIRHGWHFNAAEPGADPGRPGEPWFYIDAALGVVIPVTARGWPGTQRPADIGISTWDMLRRYARHMPGGGIGTPDVGQTASSERTDRWAISGPLEVDCMFCHGADAWHDPGEWARQIERENFQWAATAALGLAVVRGEARNVPDDYDPLLGPDPDHPEQAPPTLVYDRTRFDADDRVRLDITLRPDPRRCYTCHSVRTVGAEAVPRWRGSGDVHLRAGMTCTDCHRNGIDHMIVRGFEGETLQNRSLTAEIYTCAGCHLGAAEGGQTRERLGGRLGAPVPTHRGIPPVHFEKLTCTSCHSGPWPDRSLVRVQTSFAHGLGLASRDRGDTDPPEITLPAFAVQPDGKISPRYVVWPANWGWLRIDGARTMGLELIRAARAPRRGRPVER
jgi:hypothetical protein